MEGDNDEVVIIDPSLMPKTTQSSVFTAVSTQAHADRSRICKFLAKMDSKVEELNELEQEKAEGDSDDEYTEELLKELREDMVKVKESLKSHVDNSHNLKTMANYMTNIRPGVPETNRVRNDAKEAFEKSLKDELMIEKKVKDWTAKNKKWLRHRRKEKNKEKGEPAKTTEKNNGNPQWLMNFE